MNISSKGLGFSFGSGVQVEGEKSIVFYNYKSGLKSSGVSSEMFCTRVENYKSGK